MISLVSCLLFFSFYRQIVKRLAISGETLYARTDEFFLRQFAVPIQKSLRNKPFLIFFCIQGNTLGARILLDFLGDRGYFGLECLYRSRIMRIRYWPRCKPNQPTETLPDVYILGAQRQHACKGGSCQYGDIVSQKCSAIHRPSLVLFLFMNNTLHTAPSHSSTLRCFRVGRPDTSRGSSSVHLPCFPVFRPLPESDHRSAGGCRAP